MGNKLVYVITADNNRADGRPTKIGKAQNLRLRLRQLNTSSPVRLQVTFSSLPRNDADLVEQAAHSLLDAKRLNGEWFNVTSAEAINAIHAAIELVESGKFPETARKSVPGPRQVKDLNQEELLAWQDRNFGRRHGVQIKASDFCGIPVASWRHMLAGRMKMPGTLEVLMQYVDRFGVVDELDVAAKNEEADA